MANKEERFEVRGNGHQRVENTVSEGQRFERYVMEGGCPVNAVEELDITVPASVHAHTEVGNVSLRCLGASVVTRNCDTVTGNPGAVSRFTVRQRMRVDIPLNFEVEAYVGEGHVNYTASTAAEQIQQGGCDCNCNCD